MASPQDMERQTDREYEAHHGGDMRSDQRYQSIDDLPNSVRSVLPREAQEVYLEAYQDSWDSYEDYEGGELDRGAVAHRDGWHAVRQDFVKHEASGRWYPTGELPQEEDEDDDEGLIDQIKDIV